MELLNGVSWFISGKYNVFCREKKAQRRVFAERCAFSGYEGGCVNAKELYG
jgi:hypothetical protein